MEKLAAADRGGLGRLAVAPGHGKVRSDETCERCLTPEGKKAIHSACRGHGLFLRAGRHSCTSTVTRANVQDKARPIVNQGR